MKKESMLSKEIAQLKLDIDELERERYAEILFDCKLNVNNVLYDLKNLKLTTNPSSVKFTHDLLPTTIK